ncbi:MAG: PRC-barrel domain-containing protein [Chloroflexi bacterium]|nr:PRC-barrel domain-containing protein [Chloroflexota bacterium]
MEFNHGANVFSTEGKEIGRIDRVVIDPKTKAVTHLILRKGLILTQDKVVPVDLLVEGVNDQIIMRLDPNKLDELPDYQETHYVLANEEEIGHVNANKPLIMGTTPALYQYPPYAQTLAPPNTEPAYLVEKETNIPEGTVALKEGARVISRDEKKVGQIEQVLYDPTAHRATHFMIAKGMLLREKKMVPVEWIDEISEDEVLLSVGARMIEEIKERQPA